MMIDPEIGYSANVNIRLEVGGAILDVAQVERESLILRKPCNSPLAGYADIVITVDGREHRHPVILNQGVESDLRTVNFG